MVGDLEADRLEVRDRLAELDALLGVVDRILERARAPGRSSAPRCGRARASRPGHAVEGAAFLADHRRPHADVVEGELPGLPAEVADLGIGAPLPAAARRAASRQEEHRARGGASGRRVRARDHHDEVGAVGEGAPVLVAVDHPLVAVAARPAGDRRDVGAASGSDMANAPRNSPLAIRAGSAALLPFMPGRADQAVAAGDDLATLIQPRDSSSVIRQYSKTPEPQAAVLLVGELLDQLARDVAFSPNWRRSWA